MNYAGIVNVADDISDASLAFRQLNLLHNRYLENFIYLGTRVGKFDQASTDCPESFRVALRLDEFGHSEENLLLVRVEDLDFIARRSGMSKNELREIVNDVAAGNRSDGGGRATWASLADILQRWHDSLDNRPIFASYWEDAKSALDDPKPGWAEELRDRL